MPFYNARTVKDIEPVVSVGTISDRGRIFVKSSDTTKLFYLSPGGIEQSFTTAGSDGQVQFNSSGSQGADGNLHWDNTNKRLGIGTTAPDNELHVIGIGRIERSTAGTTSRETTLVSLGTSTGNMGDGFGSQFVFAIKDEAGTSNPIGLMQAFRAGGVDNTGEMAFWTYSAGTALEALRLDSSQRIGLNRAPTTNRLEVNGDASKTAATTWLANSDRRIKTEIEPITNALDRICSLKPVSFRYKDAYREQCPSLDNHLYFNFIAQEYQEVFPNSVKISGDEFDGVKDILQIETHAATVYTVAAIQELVGKIRDLSSCNIKLKRRLDELENRIAE